MTAHYAAAVHGRLAAGAREYGDASFRCEPPDLAAEIGEELADVAGWAVVLRARLHAADPALRAHVLGELEAVVRTAAGLHERIVALGAHLDAAGADAWGAPPAVVDPDDAPAWLRSVLGEGARVATIQCAGKAAAAPSGAKGATPKPLTPEGVLTPTTGPATSGGVAAAALRTVPEASPELNAHFMTGRATMAPVDGSAGLMNDEGEVRRG